MSYETTRTISRKRAEEWLVEEIARKWAKENAKSFTDMSDTELQDKLYELTRETNFFDNFVIVSVDNAELT